MKTKVTNKNVRNSYSTVIKIGYCDAQYLLSCIKPFGYSSGVYGWNCDFYDIDGICISTGYRPIGTQIDYNLIDSYEQKAKNINNKDEILALLKSFINEAIN